MKKPRGVAWFVLPLMLGATNVHAALTVSLQVGRIEGGALPQPISNLRAACHLAGRDQQLHCEDASLRAETGNNQELQLSGQASWSPRSWTATVTQARWADAAWSGEARVDHQGVVQAELQLQSLPFEILAPWIPADAALPAPRGALTLDAAYQRQSPSRASARLDASIHEFGIDDAQGRYAAERASAALRLQAVIDGDLINAQGRIDAGDGQVYVEPVFIDLQAAPLTTQFEASFDRARVLVPRFSLDGVQQGVVGQFHVDARNLAWRGAPQVSTAHASFNEIALDALLRLYLAPFLAGSRWENLSGSGMARLDVNLVDTRPSSLSLNLQQASIATGSPTVEVLGIDGDAYWQAGKEQPRDSTLSWSSARYGDLPFGASTLRFTTAARDVRLQQPWRLPILDGALNVQRLQLRDWGRSDMKAEVAAVLEPIELATLCKAFGWPEFGGRLSGSVPGVRLDQNELSFDGGLSAQVFDGEITIERLRLLDPLGRLIKLLADVKLRKLDLKAITQAFSFGRIEGRVDGDVSGLRVLDWRPVAFDARVYSSPGDRSAHRISQRAIDNLSSLGGGPTGVLSRGALRFFDDFAYERIGWSCVLDNGICQMGGLEPTDHGGYVLVEGRWLPRIEVIGYNPRVDWNRFVEQLLAVRNSQGVEVR